MSPEQADPVLASGLILVFVPNALIGEKPWRAVFGRRSAQQPQVRLLLVHCHPYVVRTGSPHHPHGSGTASSPTIRSVSRHSSVCFHSGSQPGAESNPVDRRRSYPRSDLLAWPSRGITVSKASSDTAPIGVARRLLMLSSTYTYCSRPLLRRRSCRPRTAGFVCVPWSVRLSGEVQFPDRWSTCPKSRRRPSTSSVANG